MKREVEQAARLACRAGGALMTMLARGKGNRSGIARAADDLTEAARVLRGISQ